MLTVKDLYKSYRVGGSTYDVLSGVSLTVEKGEFVAVMGPSGSGKTTLLNCISCYTPADSGSILLDGVELAPLKEDELAGVRNRKLGFVFQDFLLLDGLSVRENILLPAILSGHINSTAEARADQLCDVFGIGGIRALNAMGIQQDVYHCNEGHAAFTGIERIRNLIHNDKLSFSEALEVVRSSSLFTTHTPVPAGHDAFPESMIRQYMSHYPDVLGITWEQYINLGKTNPNDPNEKFSMSVLACNLSQEVNGVSWLHGEVSKDILGNMWPGYFKNELHIGYVTNGVHYVLAKENDTFENIGRKFRISPRNLRKFNDLKDKQAQPVPGETVYIERKKKRWTGNSRHHIARRGETAYSVGQSYAIRTRSIEKLNKLRPGEELEQGRQIRIK